MNGFGVLNSRNTGTEGIIINSFPIRKALGSSHLVLDGRARARTQGCLISQTSSSFPVSIAGLSKQPGRAPEKSEGRKEGFYHTVSYLLHMRKLGHVLSFLQKKFLGPSESFCSRKSGVCIQLVRLCDAAGAVEAESFVDGLCARSSLPINQEHLEMFLSIPRVPSRETPQVRGHTCFDFLI